MLTRKAKYGLKAMAFLAALPEGKFASVTEISAACSIPKKYLDQILSQLRAAELAMSRRGKGGGYRAARPAQETSVGMIIRVLSGPLTPLPCASAAAFASCHDCANQPPCLVRQWMREARDDLAALLERRMLARHRGIAAP